MSPDRFHAISSRYPALSVAVFGDFCLDRYLDIDATRHEISLETGLPVHNVTRVRAQAGGAGTILNNLTALGIGTIFPVGFVGEDGEGFELIQAMRALPGVRLEHLERTRARRTHTYCKPLLITPDKPPQEQNRLDFKNYTATPPQIQELLISHLTRAVESVNALIVLDQVELPETGAVTPKVISAVKELAETHPKLLILADSRHGLHSYPPLTFKMNAAELALGALPTGSGPASSSSAPTSLERIRETATALARKNGKPVFITLAERGILCAEPDGLSELSPALPLRGPIDIVGAGDAVTANLTAALAAGASVSEAVGLANAAASVVIHKLGTTGTASVAEVEALMRRNAA